MAKQERTAQELHAEVMERINANPEVREDRPQIRVALPRWHEPDADGCNWDISIVSNWAGHEHVVIEAIPATRRQWNLRDGPPAA